MICTGESLALGSTLGETRHLAPEEDVSGTPLGARESWLLSAKPTARVLHPLVLRAELSGNVFGAQESPRLPRVSAQFPVVLSKDMFSSVVLEGSSVAILAGSLGITSTEDLYHNDGCNRFKKKG
jgi:hypothetical protein